VGVPVSLSPHIHTKVRIQLVDSDGALTWLCDTPLGRPLKRSSNEADAGYFPTDAMFGRFRTMRSIRRRWPTVVRLVPLGER